MRTYNIKPSIYSEGPVVSFLFNVEPVMGDSVAVSLHCSVTSRDQYLKKLEQMGMTLANYARSLREKN